MPATVTHAFFVKDVYDILPNNISRKLDLERCKMFGQSLDSLFFYNLLSFKSGKDIREFKNYFHKNKSQDFFINLLKYIKDNKIDDQDTYSFLMGFICHYVLDSTIHPYVFYKTGLFNKRKPSTYKYNNVHHFMETFIDNDMIRRRMKCNPYTYDFVSFCFENSSFSLYLNNTIDNVFYNTFRIKNMSEIYDKSLRQMETCLRLFRRDPHGIKKVLYKTIDTFTPKNAFRFEAVSYHYPLEDKHNFLNNNHNMWRNPTNFDDTSTESFIDLYIKAIKEAKRIITACFKYLNDEDIELEKIFTNLSYVTGLDCNDKKELKYFEF